MGYGLCAVFVVRKEQGLHVVVALLSESGVREVAPGHLTYAGADRRVCCGPFTNKSAPAGT